MDQNENKNYNFENDPGQTQPDLRGQRISRERRMCTVSREHRVHTVSRTWQRIAE